MKLFVRLFLFFLLIVILLPVFSLGYFGFVPGLSDVLGANKPRDLGIKYTRQDLKAIREKSHVVYVALADNSNPVLTRQFSGKRELTAEFTSAQITATLNNQPWKYWPYKNVQVKFNSDGSGEISGVLIKGRVPGYAQAIGVPKEAVEFAMKYLPSDPVFYLKGKGGLSGNKVEVFEPQKFEIGRVSLPVGVFLAINKQNLMPKVYAQDIGQMTREPTGVKDKKSLIIGYINDSLATHFGSFYAKKAYFKEDKLIFDGTISDKISYTP